MGGRGFGINPKGRGTLGPFTASDIMDLILWRHADAGDAIEDATDAQRALTSKGEKQAQRMAQWLHRHLPESTRVIASPTVRTRQTAQAYGDRFKLLDALAPGGTVEGLLAAARWPDAREAVLVIGHQPTLGMTAAWLLCGQAQPWSVKKGAIWWLRQRDRESRGDVVLHAVLTPDRV
jgi:phosphohistidine phosphatase